MRIAYLNPWTNAAENQAYFSLATAGRTVGVDLVSCQTPEELEASDVEFAISVASSIPKVADVPSYLTVHEPTSRFLNRSFYMNNLLSHDGFLTISDGLARFVKDICLGAGRYPGVGFYYNTPQISRVRTDLARVVSDDALRIVYIGTNWDRRAPGLLQELDNAGVLCIHGPGASWTKHGYVGYAGALPFDGEAPQRAYASAGLGLVLLSDDHLREDVISNRIFEIISVGAVAVCPRTPWIEKHFADSVLYFTPSTSGEEMAAAILRHHADVVRSPEEAQERAGAARKIFEERFAAERMLENAVAYHEEVQAAHRRRLTALEPQPHVSVVVRCGRHRLQLLKDAVDSVRRQTSGRFTVILVKFHDLDLSEITADTSGSIGRFVELAVPAGSRSETLRAGLAAVETEFFAILDDDDFWLSDHMETLFAAARAAGNEFDVAFSGSVAVAAAPTRIETSLVWNRNIQTFGLRREAATVAEVTASFSSNCFVARTALVQPHLAVLDDLETAEDSLLIAIVCRNKRPIFSYKATAFFRRGYSGESDFASIPTRARDLRSLQLRAGMLLRPAWLHNPPQQQWSPSSRAWVAAARDAVGDVVVLGRIAVARVTGRDHPSARKDLLVSPLRRLRDGG